MDSRLLAENTTTPYFKNPSFSGHQTFPFRYTWLKKGFDAVKKNANVFSDEDALVTLGVGKNMVSSIQHWCLTTKIIEKIQNSSDKRNAFKGTDFGKAIFDDEKGLDPYLENPATLWWLHWNIARNQVSAATWSWAFSFFNYPEFTRESLIKDLMDWLKQQENIRKLPSEKTIKQDIGCFIRTYCNSRSAVDSIIEDTFDCPLVELDLISEVPNENRYQFNLGTKPSLSDSIITFFISDFWDHQPSDTSTLSFSKIMYSKFSPGQVLKIDENTMVMHLENLELMTNRAFTYDDTAGLKEISRHEKIDSFDLFKRIYE